LDYLVREVLQINSGQYFTPSKRKLFTVVYVKGNLVLNGIIFYVSSWRKSQWHWKSLVDKYCSSCNPTRHGYIWLQPPNPTASEQNRSLWWYGSLRLLENRMDLLAQVEVQEVESPGYSVLGGTGGAGTGRYVFYCEGLGGADAKWSKWW
jgi:hypothetical protein